MDLTILPPAFFVVFAGVFGLVLGSLTNVLIWRIPRKESIVKPGSHCPSCKRELKWYDNVPVLAYFLWLRGKCRFCGTKIALRYPIVEALVALLAVWGAIVFQGDPVKQLLVVVLSPILVALSFIDNEILELPDGLIISLITTGIVFTFVKLGTQSWLQITVIVTTWIVLALLWRWILGPEPEPTEPGKEDEDVEPTVKERWGWGFGAFALGLIGLLGGFWISLEWNEWNALWGIFIGGGGLLALWGFFLFLQGRQALGLGDVKLMTAMGMILGPGLTILAYIFGAVSGIFVWFFLRLRHGQRSEQPFPFGPSLIIGCWIALLHGNEIVKWYASLLFGGM